MAGITLAWLIGETIIIWRSVTKHHRPPMPGELLGSSAFFALLAVIAEYQPARGAATMLAFGIDIAAYLEVPFVTVQGQGGQGQGTPMTSAANPYPGGISGRPDTYPATGLPTSSNNPYPGGITGRG